MTIHEHTISKLQNLPEPLAQKVSDFIDFLVVKENRGQWELWKHFSESLKLAESDFSDYLTNLEAYEESLAREEIKW